MSDTVLSVSGITKRFPGVTALDSVSFDIRAGEVHALVGENGAGKSTLMKTLAGLHRPDAGEIIHRGGPVEIASPLDARRRGILLIHQELSLSPELSVAENIYLGAWPTNALGVLRARKLRRDAQAALEALGCDFGPENSCRHPVDRQAANGRDRPLAGIQRQRRHLRRADGVADGRGEDPALRNDPEPARAGGGHRLHLAQDGRDFELTDRITVLRDGVVQGTVETAETDVDRITRMMIGRDLSSYFVRAREQFGDETLRVEGLSKAGLFRDVDLSVRAGEVLGLYGLIGAGRSEVVETIFGLRTPDAGRLFWQGREVPLPTPRQAIGMGMALVPESRKEQGLVLGMGGRENITLPHLDLFSRLGVMQPSKELEAYARYREALDIRTTGPEQAVATLSGGNQQKFVLAKWLCAEPKLIILDEPTRGIDVGSKSAIHELIAGLAERGLAVLVISSEMPEVLGVSHRVLTMSAGRVVGEFAGDCMTEEALIDAVSR